MFNADSQTVKAFQGLVQGQLLVDQVETMLGTGASNLIKRTAKAGVAVEDQLSVHAKFRGTDGKTFAVIQLRVPPGADILCVAAFRSEEQAGALIVAIKEVADALNKIDAASITPPEDPKF